MNQNAMTIITRLQQEITVPFSFFGTAYVAPA